jgi:hypothetical protein
MNRKADPTTLKQRKKTAVANSPEQDSAWKRADERLDEALRQTFPASDALSITRKSRVD